MDGGGHDHMGHGIQVGHGGDGFNHHDHGTFLDGGSDAQGHHGTGHGSGDGGFLANLLGYNQHAGHHGFLSHLLGLDHDHSSHHLHESQVASLQADGSPAPGHAPSQGAIWNSALQHVKLAHLFEGFKVTENFWLMTLFGCFIAWLFVVYWIRRHEPFANAVLGKTPVCGNAADRRVISGASEAIPIRTSSQSNSFYVPNPGSTNMPSSMVRTTDLIPSAAASMTVASPNSYLPVDPTAPMPRVNLRPAPMPSPLAALPTGSNTFSRNSSASANFIPPPPPMMPTSPSGQPPSYSSYQSNQPNLGPYAGSGVYTPQASSGQAPQSVPMQSDVSAPVQIYNVPIEGGSRVRMCVNR